MDYSQQEQDVINARQLRSQAMAAGLRILRSSVIDLVTWMRWHGEIAMTSRRLGPIDGARGPMPH